MERAGRVEHDLEARDLDDFVKGALLGDVGHDHGLELVLADAGVRVVDLVGLVLGPDGGHHRVAALKKRLEDVSCRGGPSQYAQTCRWGGGGVLEV